VKRHVDPFPAVSDLFSGLLIATFGGLILFAGLLPGNNILPPEPGPVDPVDIEAKRLQTEARKALEQHLQGTSRECGGDVCVDVSIEFELDEDRVGGQYRESLRRACSALRQVVRLHQSELEISIEGHTDSTQPKDPDPPKPKIPERDRFLYNWNLSARRASSVLYEFKECGLGPADYRIVALGYADTRPIGKAENSRRTTFRLRPDRVEIAKRLARSPHSVSE
jgi:flagellar motor protein MotB